MGNKKALAIELVTKAIDALVDAITDELTFLTDNGSKEIAIDLGHNSYIVFFDENGTIMFSNEENDYEFSISAVEINMLIDILNALTEGKYVG